MRVTDDMRLHNWMKNLQSTSKKLEKAEQAISSGKSLLKPSDNPSGVSQVIRIKEQIHKLDKYIETADDGLGWLKTTEVTLAALTETLSEARETALEGASAAVSENQRQELGKYIGEIIDYVVSLGNTEYGGRYLFAGEETEIKPFQLNGEKTGVEPYAGGMGSVNRQIMRDDIIAVNYSGQETFVDSKVFSSLFDLKQGLDTNNLDLVNSASSDLDDALKSVISQRALMGSKINRFTDIKEQHTMQRDHFDGLVGEIEEGNLAEMIATLKKEQTAYEAALAVGARINSISLLDFLR